MEPSGQISSASLLGNLHEGNQLFSAGLGLILVTTGLAVGRKIGVQALLVARRKIFVSVEVASKDPSYTWLLHWLSKNSPQTKIVTSQLSVETVYKRLDNNDVSATSRLVPGSGTHYLRHRGVWFKIDRSREKSMIDLKSGAPWETIMLTTLQRNYNVILELFEEAKRDAIQNEEGKLIIYNSFGPEWRPFGQPRKRRPFNSVILRKGLSEGILSDVISFLGSEKWYGDRGIPYRRGYLLYGSPGTGKTSFILALAGKLKYNICVISMSERGLTDDRLAYLLANAPPKSFILIEDIDVAFSNRDDAESGKNKNISPLTLSGFLNALDGVVSSEERIMFMTTNYIQILDAALLRPGRVDYSVLIDKATVDQARRMFMHFYDRQDLCLRFIEAIHPSHTSDDDLTLFSPAEIQAYFIAHKESPDDLLKKLKEIRYYGESRK